MMNLGRWPKSGLETIVQSQDLTRLIDCIPGSDSDVASPITTDRQSISIDGLARILALAVIQLWLF